MSDKLARYLIELGKDPDRLLRRGADSESELRAAGLSREERDAVLRRDPEAIRAALLRSAAEPVVAVFLPSGP